MFYKFQTCSTKGLLRLMIGTGGATAKEWAGYSPVYPGVDVMWLEPCARRGARREGHMACVVTKRPVDIGLGALGPSDGERERL